MPELEIRITIADFPEEASPEFFSSLVEDFAEEALKQHIGEGTIVDIDYELI